MSEKKLTEPQIRILARAHRGRLYFTMVERKGGAMFRMVDRLAVAGLITLLPRRITGAGAAALDAARTWCPFCKKKHPGGYKCMGHHP